MLFDVSIFLRLANTHLSKTQLLLKKRKVVLTPRSGLGTMSQASLLLDACLVLTEATPSSGWTETISQDLHKVTLEQ